MSQGQDLAVSHPFRAPSAARSTTGSSSFIRIFFPKDRAATHRPTDGPGARASTTPVSPCELPTPAPHSQGRTKGPPRSRAAGPSWLFALLADHADIAALRAFLTLRHLELNLLVLFEILVAVADDR